MALHYGGGLGAFFRAGFFFAMLCRRAEDCSWSLNQGFYLLEPSPVKGKHGVIENRCVSAAKPLRTGPARSSAAMRGNGQPGVGGVYNLGTFIGDALTLIAHN